MSRRLWERSSQYIAGLILLIPPSNRGRHPLTNSAWKIYCFDDFDDYNFVTRGRFLRFNKKVNMFMAILILMNRDAFLTNACKWRRNFKIMCCFGMSVHDHDVWWMLIWPWISMWFQAMWKEPGSSGNVSEIDMKRKGPGAFLWWFEPRSNGMFLRWICTRDGLEVTMGCGRCLKMELPLGHKIIINEDCIELQKVFWGTRPDIPDILEAPLCPQNQALSGGSSNYSS